MTLRTLLTCYRFDISAPAQKKQWEALRRTLRRTHPHCMHSHNCGRSYHYQPHLDGLTLTLETEFLFSNQWNTAPIDGVSAQGLRVFDWALDACLPNRKIKQGYYLQQTAEMREIRRNTARCGYCGKQEPVAKGYVFCPHCIGSEYLKAEDLRLTRMTPVDTEDSAVRFAELTEAERAHLMPLYLDAQMYGRTARDKARIAKQRADLLAKFEKETTSARIEFEGFSWLMDRGFRTDNVIFYSHTGRFSFGWRQPLSGELLDRLLDVVSEFPHPYELVCADGRKLEGY